MLKKTRVYVSKSLLFTNKNKKEQVDVLPHVAHEFDHGIRNAICLPGSVLTFNKSGVQGKGLQNSQQTAYFQDPSRVYKLLCSDRIVVIESRTNAENSLEKHSNLYILANE